MRSRFVTFFLALTLCSNLLAALTFVSPLDRQIYQRDFYGNALIQIIATGAGGSAVTAQVRANPISTGTDTGFVSIPLISGTVQGTLKVAAGWYTLEIKTFDIGSGLVDDVTLNHLGAGDNFMIFGQSNAANYFSPLVATAPDDRVNCRGITGADPWRLCTDPMPTADNTLSSGWPVLGNLLVANNGLPVGFINAAQGNTSSNDWLPGFSVYLRAKAAVQLFGKYGFKHALFDQGENDAAFSVTQSVYTTNVTKIFTQLRQDAGWEVPFLIAIATHPNETPGAGVIAAQTGLLGSFYKVFAGANTDSLDNTYRYDGVHFNTTTGRAAFANLWYNAIQAVPTVQPTTPSVIDSTNNKFCFFTGTWKCIQGL